MITQGKLANEVTLSNETKFRFRIVMFVFAICALSILALGISIFNSVSITNMKAEQDITSTYIYSKTTNKVYRTELLMWIDLLDKEMKSQNKDFNTPLLPTIDDIQTSKKPN